MGDGVGVGFSISRDAAEAGREAAAKALEQSGGGIPDFVLVFATVGYDQERLIRAIREATGNAPLSGCSGEGVITRGMATETNFCVGVMACRSERLRFDHLLVEGCDAGAAEIGGRLADRAKSVAQEDLLAYFLFADGLCFDFEPLLQAFEGGLPPSLRRPILGGLASDNWAVRTTYQYHDDEVITGGISLVLLSGSGSVAWGVNHGCVPIGTKRTITKARANVIFEIDDMPALDALKDYIDEDLKSQWNKVSLNLCLGFKTPEDLRKKYDEYVIRYMTDKNDLDGSVTIQSDVVEGAELWIVRRDKELIRAGVETVSREILERAGERRPLFVLQCECVGRGKVVFREQEKNDLIRSLQERIDGDAPWLGFYTYGEIAPIGAVNFFHNFSVVVAAVYP